VKIKNMKLVKATETEIQQFIAQHVAWSVENRYCNFFSVNST
jgi:hypothetical protein